jgi:inhibitor of KinA
MHETIVSVEPLGDSALIVRWPDVGDDIVEKIRIATQALTKALPPDRFAVVPAFVTLAVHFDATQIGTKDAANLVQSLLKNAADIPTQAARIVEIPVCYDIDVALDLEHLAEHCGIAVTDLVQIHSKADYVVRMIGFSPGFPYLSGLPASIQCPRRATPRLNVPAGSVAIGGSQTGIYPQATPGGWKVIGRTPLRLFDVNREEPCLLAAGDRVHFRSIDRQTFDRLLGEVGR